MKGHTGIVFGVAFSPNGKQIASASFDHTAKIWDAKTGKEIVTLKGHTVPVLAVAFEPDGKHVRTVASPFYGDQITEPGEVWRWDAQTGEQLKKLSGHKVPTFAVAVSPDGTRIAAVGGIGTESELDVWDARSGKILFNFRSEAVLPFMAVDFSPDGKTVAVGGGRKVYGVDATTGKLLFESAEHPDPVYATVFSPDGAHIASAGTGKPPGIRLWDGRTGKKLPMIATSQRSIKSLAYSRDRAKIASAAFDGTARIFDVATGAELARVKYDKNVNAVALDRDGTHLAVGGDDQTVRIYSVQKLESAPKPATPPERKAPPKEDSANARQVTDAFLEAAVAGKIEEARMRIPTTFRRTRSRKFSKLASSASTSASH